MATSRDMTEVMRVVDEARRAVSVALTSLCEARNPDSLREPDVAMRLGRAVQAALPPVDHHAVWAAFYAAAHAEMSPGDWSALLDHWQAEERSRIARIEAYTDVVEATPLTPTGRVAD